MLVRTYNLSEYDKRKKLIKDVFKYFFLSYDDVSREIGVPMSAIAGFLNGSNNSAEILIRIDAYLEKEFDTKYSYKKGGYLYYEN